MEFSDADSHNVVAVTPTSLVVTTKSPYIGWEQFEERIGGAIEALTTVMDVPRLQRVGLRYINRISLSGDPVNLDEWFQAAPTTPDAFPERLVGIVARWESHYDDDPDRDLRLLYTFNTVPTPMGEWN